MNKLTLLTLLYHSIGSLGFSQATIPFFYGGAGNWGFASMAGGNLTSNNADYWPARAEHRLDATGHYIRLYHQTLSSGTFTVDLIAKNPSGGSWSGTVLLQSSPDGSTWTTQTTITSIGVNGAVISPSASLPSGTKYVRVYFSNRVANYILGVNNFSVSGSLLPISLLSFEAKINEQNINLFWSTATEKNNDYMAVERSVDGKLFSEIGRVKGLGYSVERVDYSFTDHFPYPGTNYYRLRQVDYDGTSTFHKVIAVEFTGKSTNGLNFVQNQEVVKAQFRTSAAAAGELVLLDVIGRVIRIQKFEKNALSAQISTNGLPRGLYVVQIHQNDGLIKAMLLIKP